mgnify:CR=1 FL=1
MSPTVQELKNKIELESFADNLSQKFHKQAGMSPFEFRNLLREVTDINKVEGSFIDYSVQEGITGIEKEDLKKKLVNFVKTLKASDFEKCDTVGAVDKKVCNYLNGNSYIKDIFGDFDFKVDDSDRKIEELKSKQESNGLSLCGYACGLVALLVTGAVCVYATKK